MKVVLKRTSKRPTRYNASRPSPAFDSASPRTVPYRGTVRLLLLEVSVTSNDACLTLCTTTLGNGVTKMSEHPEDNSKLKQSLDVQSGTTARRLFIFRAAAVL